WTGLCHDSGATTARAPPGRSPRLLSEVSSMRKHLVFPLLLLSLLAAGCDDPTGSERRSLLGLWTSSDFGPATIRMTLSEVGRSVEGAGSWLTAEAAMAFGVSGAHAEETVSLLFDLEGTPDVTFTGEFTDEDTLEGTLTGGALREVPITFARAQRDE